MYDLSDLAKVMLNRPFLSYGLRFRIHLVRKRRKRRKRRAFTRGNEFVMYKAHLSERAHSDTYTQKTTNHFSVSIIELQKSPSTRL